nr:hypothetical protein [Kribbella qitaiheensis]
MASRSLANGSRWIQDGRTPELLLNRRALPPANDEPVASRVRISFSKPCRVTRSSLSTKVMYSPSACRTPVLRAGPRPWFCCSTIRNRGSRAQNSLAMVALSSGDPSSTRIASKSVHVCRAIESRHSPM